MIGIDNKYNTSNTHLQGFQNLEGVISQNQQDISYTPFNKIETISEGDYHLEVEYGVDNHRVKSILKEGEETIRTKLFTSLGIEKIIEGDEVTELTYVPVGDAVAIYVNQNSNKQWYYVYKDLLGSFSKVTDEDGILVYEQSFDAWGRKTNPEDWNYENIPETPTWLRGYTGHEHLPEFDLINMNGRVYDPKLSRMLSPDNYVQSPGFSQSYNRYAYVWNNPLKYTDPSGEEVVTATTLAIKLGIAALKGSGIAAGLYTTETALSPEGFNSWNWTEFGYALAGGAINGSVGKLSSVTLYKKSILKIALSPKTQLSSDGISFGLGLSTSADFKYLGLGYDVSAMYDLISTGNEETNKFKMTTGYGLRIGSKNYNANIYSTTFHTSTDAQQVGGIGLSIGKFNVRYENDGAPMSNWWPGFVNDGEDRYRTAAARISFGDFHIQLNMYTGDPGTGYFDPSSVSENYPEGYYEGGNVDDFRLGALAIGYGDFRIGMNSEGIRNTFQNEFAHNIVKPQPYFKVLNNDRHLYYNWGTTNRYTLW